MNKLIVETKSLDVKAKSLTSDLEKSTAQLQYFSSRSKEIDDMIGRNKITWNKGDLGFNETSSQIGSSFEKKFLTFSKPEIQNLKLRVIPRFIPICHPCGKLEHIRPKYLELLSGNETNDVCVWRPK